METIQVPKADFERLVTKATKLDEIEKTGYVLKPDHDKKVDELNSQNNSHINEITALQKENAKLKQDLADCEAETPDNDLTGWVKNGLQVEVTTGNTKVITNYKPA
jgi:regulator of replication initiation timing